MHIYLLNTQEFKSSLENLPNNVSPQFCGQNVYNDGTSPYIFATDDFDVLKHNEVIKKFFLKATTIEFPNFESLDDVTTYSVRRQHGLYFFGNAKAELIPSSEKNTNGRYWLKSETSVWEGIADMKKLKERLWAGTIYPSVRYDKPQNQSVFQVLSEVLNLHKLSPIKRFFLAWRLSRTN